jgi:predicted transcriptional regulator
LGERAPPKAGGFQDNYATLKDQSWFFALIFDVFEGILYKYKIGGCYMKTTTVRIHDDVLGRIDGLAKALSRPRSWVITQAIERFLEYEEWFVKEVKDGLVEVERGEITTHAEVINRFRRWGADAS